MYPFLHSLLIPFGLPSLILHLDQTHWAKTLVFYIIFGYVCLIQMTTLSFSVHVNVFYCIVTHRLLDSAQTN